LEPRNAGALFFTLAAALYVGSSEADAWIRYNGFPLVWCPTCEKTQKMIFDLLPDIVCDHCKSIIATLHAPRAPQARARPKRAARAREMAGQTLDRHELTPVG
jgi:hypothetical protein